jgi:hypothetical protein
MFDHPPPSLQAQPRNTRWRSRGASRRRCTGLPDSPVGLARGSSIRHLDLSLGGACSTADVGAHQDDIVTTSRSIGPTNTGGPRRNLLGE